MILSHLINGKLRKIKLNFFFLSSAPEAVCFILFYSLTKREIFL